MPPTFAARVLYRLQGEAPALTIFSYHAVSPEPLDVYHPCFVPLSLFREQMERIARRYEVLPLEEALGRLWSGRLRFPAAVLTFDDGYRNNYEIALPVLRQLGLPMSIFVCTGPVAGRRTFWFARLHRAICLTARQEVEWQGGRTDLAGPLQRAAASHLWRSAFKKLPPAEIDAESDALCRALEVEEGDPADPTYGLLDETGLKALAADGLVTLGAHTRHHWILSRLPAAEQRAEIAASADDLERWTGRRPRSFAYPNGGSTDFTADSESILDALGFKAAVTTIVGTCKREQSWWRLPRISMDARFWEGWIR